METAARSLNLRCLEEAYAGRGSPAYPPAMMLRLALYETLEGHGSPRHWAKHAKDSKALQWLLRGMVPSQRACYRFRDRLGAVVQKIHEELVRVGFQEDLLTSPQTVAQDGSFHRSGASRHQLFNKARLEKRRDELQRVLQADAEGRQPEAPLPRWMPRTPAGRAQLSARLEQAQLKLEHRLEQNAAKPKSHRRQEQHVCLSVSDPEAVVTRDKEKVYGPLYNVQYLTDYQSRVVLGFQVSDAPSDAGTLLPMVDQVQSLVGNTLKQVVTDSTYATLSDLKGCDERNLKLIAHVQANSWSEAKRQRKGAVPGTNKRDFKWLAEEGTFQCPAGHKLKRLYREKAKRADGEETHMVRYWCPPTYCTACPLAANCAKTPSRGRTIKRLVGEELIEAQRERMKQPEFQKLHRQRGAVVERTIADAKAHRDARRFHGRSKLRAIAETGLKVIAQNILTLERLRRLKAFAAAVAVAVMICGLVLLASPGQLVPAETSQGVSTLLVSSEQAWTDEAPPQLSPACLPEVRHRASQVLHADTTLPRAHHGRSTKEHNQAGVGRATGEKSRGRGS